MLILQWSKLPRPYVLRWVGPNMVKPKMAMTELIIDKIPVIIGPPGSKGPKGDPGSITGLPEIIDGGNF